MSFVPAPIDPTSAERLARAGLELRLVDTTDDRAVERWIEVERRGFHQDRGTAEHHAEVRPRYRDRRTTGVYDPSGPAAQHPIATTQSWVAPLTVPGGAEVPLWSIAGVTVAPTHRRRGVARAVIEGELRAAAAQGVPLAGLTVSEATIYGRFGFGVATFGEDLEIDTRRVRWSGPEAPGRLHFVDPEELSADAARIADAARAVQPGGLAYDQLLLGSAIGLLGDERAALRTVRYDDADGTPSGFACYQLGAETGPHAHTVTVRHLLGATDEATAALWRFLLELDLVGEVRAPARPVDDPVAWQLGDLRAARRRLVDRLWLRILDLPAALSARRYGAAGSVVLDVADPYELAGGRFLLESDADGRGRLEALTGDGPAGAASVALSIGDLSSLYLGGVSPVTLARAGRIDERTPGAALALARLFAADRAPWLMLGF